MKQRAILLPAAGASSRMRGRDKLLEDVFGAPCLRVMAERSLESGAEVIVTVPSLEHARVTVLDGLDVTLVAVPDASEGMAASLRRGAKAAEGCSALMVLPPDMPSLLVSDIKEMWRIFDVIKGPIILRATTGCGEHGHPVIFDAAFLPAFQALSGDSGAAPILRAQPDAVRLHPLPDERARADLDRPEDWAAWHRAQDAEE
ncbi:nucleotidyltransferase family protein [Lentibacter algarum]|uniref:nucleotidyltransferase family protein n=1 Tax=Lentibacter algarum TaxID=576131 RepID=UPI001C083688|nr:nucleotidyltransferase family protein [Lentibacter algarum]